MDLAGINFCDFAIIYSIYFKNNAINLIIEVTLFNRK